ncbi:hypothetical protein C8R45DRAFT_1180041 [Mycena sanguinolenta]|nr:hypothetical protein C8R45DRAFT_1180041 [Mycena sanguinolenta]
MDPELSISTLRSALALIHKRLGPYSSLILTLPHEITAKIFIHFLPMYPASHGSADSPRQLVLPTAIEFNINRIPFTPSRRIFDIWVKRSGSLPLSLYFNLRIPSDYPDSEEAFEENERFYQKFVESSVGAPETPHVLVVGIPHLDAAPSMGHLNSAP